MTRAGVLLVGHGTRSALGESQFLRLAEEVSRRLPLPVEPAFLELTEPSIEQAVQRLLSREIDALVIAPLLLFAAGHAKTDVPAAVSAALAKHGGAELPSCQAAHFGCHPLIVELAHLRLMQALSAGGPLPRDQTLLIMVGRGSHDPSAVEEMHQLARLVAQRAELPHVEVAFLAMASPEVADVLAAVDHERFRRVVVLPHLLFHGELSARLEQQVGKLAKQRPGQEWLVSRVLADDLPPSVAGQDLLAAAASELIACALPGAAR